MLVIKIEVKEVTFNFDVDFQLDWVKEMKKNGYDKVSEPIADIKRDV